MDDPIKEIENLVKGITVMSMKQHNDTKDRFTITMGDEVGGPSFIWTSIGNLILTWPFPIGIFNQLPAGI